MFGLLTFSAVCAQKKRQKEPKNVTDTAREVKELYIKGNRIFATLAKTPEERALGLMFRTYLAPDSGMLFVFEKEETLRFWMKNTYIPLAIAFIDANGVITDILEMTPLDTITPYTSSKPVRYALEVNADWFFLNNITPNDTVLGLPMPLRQKNEE